MQRRSLFRISASLALLGSGFGLAACGGGGGDPATEPTPPVPPAEPVVRTFAYVANFDPGEVLIYEVGADGALSPAGSVPAVRGCVSVTVHPSGRFAYVLNDEEEEFFAYAIDAESGMLSFAGRFLQDDPPFDLCFHPDGKFAYGNLTGGRIAIYGVDLDTGALGQPEITADGHSVLGLAVAPSGQVLFVARSDDTVSSYRVDVDDAGALTLINTVATPEGPGSLVVAPSGAFLYVGTAVGEITVHAIETTGALQPGNATPAGNSVGTIAVDPSGRFAYAVTALSTGYRVSAYTIEAGALTEVGTSQPSDYIFDLGISPSGQHVYTTRAGFLTSYAIGSDGLLSEGTTTAVSNPVGITIVDISQ